MCIHTQHTPVCAPRLLHQVNVQDSKLCLLHHLNAQGSPVRIRIRHCRASGPFQDRRVGVSVSPLQLNPANNQVGGHG